jgi:Family of unknown function (DUF6444)
VPRAAQAAVLALVRQHEQRLQALQQQVDQLKQRLKQNSTNSSRPPSSDPPHVKRRPPKPSSGRRRGGQPGHARQQRPLVPPEQVKQTIPLRPSECRRCGQALDGEDPQPRRHQVPWALGGYGQVIVCDRHHWQVTRPRPNGLDDQGHEAGALKADMPWTTSCCSIPTAIDRFIAKDW